MLQLNTMARAGLCFLPWLIVLAGQNVLAVEVVVQPGQSLQDALTGLLSGDVLVLECGVYPEQGLEIPEGVTLRSIDGDPDCAQILTNGLEPALFFYDCTEATRVEGISFSRMPQAMDWYTLRGGGALLISSSPTVVNCRFENLEAVYGGAVFCQDSSDPFFTDCVFRNNSARAVGGALAAVGFCTPRLENCLVVENNAVSAGGALNLAKYSQAALHKCTVAENAQGTGPAVAGWFNSYIAMAVSIVSEMDSQQELWVGDTQNLFQPQCSDIYAGDLPVPVNPAFPDYISADPLFCATLAGDNKFNLDEASPCTPNASPSCGGMGAMPVGCALSPVQEPGSEPQLPQVTRLQDIYPNPFNPLTTIHFDLAQPGQVEVSVFDIAGRLVKNLVNETMPLGSHEIIWMGRDSQGRNAAAGVYFVRLKTSGKTDSARITLIK